MVKKAKKSEPKPTLLFVALLFLGLLAIFSFAKSSAAPEKPESIVILPPTNGPVDMGSKDEGTLFIQFRAKEDLVIMGDVIPSKVQLFRSKNTGLAIMYLFEEKKLTAGFPLLKTPEVALFDGNEHQIAYTYKKGENQTIFFDSVMLASSVYHPENVIKISGLIIGQPENRVEGPAGAVEYTMYEKALSPGEIAAYAEQMR